MEDFRLKVFLAVSKHQSFTKAAAELFISQPAVTKHIKQLEADLAIQLFERKGSFILLTKGGEILLKHVNKIFDIYNELQLDLGLIKNNKQGSLRIGASTTVAQYFISPILASFYEKFPKIQLSLLNGNTQQIETAILDKSIDIGLVEGKKHMPGLKYMDFIEDELVAVVHTKSKLSKNQQIALENLYEIPLVMRERGSGTLEVIESALKENGIKLGNLNVIMHLGSTESIKSFLEFSNALAFFSLKAIQKEVEKGEFKILQIENFRILRKFSFVHVQGFQDSLSTSFIHFSKKHYNQK
jgi:LysR family transcriptional regulator, transcriptional activator of the cysJI operon